MCLQKDSIKNYQSFEIIDDLLATGGTAACRENVDQPRKKVNGLSIVVELKELNGRENLSCKVNSQLLYSIFTIVYLKNCHVNWGQRMAYHMA